MLCCVDTTRAPLIPIILWDPSGLAISGEEFTRRRTLLDVAILLDVASTSPLTRSASCADYHTGSLGFFRIP